MAKWYRNHSALEFLYDDRTTIFLAHDCVENVGSIPLISSTPSTSPPSTSPLENDINNEKEAVAFSPRFGFEEHGGSGAGLKKGGFWG